MMIDEELEIRLQRAIDAKCDACKGRAEAIGCSATSCAIWPYRPWNMGDNKVEGGDE